MNFRIFFGGEKFNKRIKKLARTELLLSTLGEILMRGTIALCSLIAILTISPSKIGTVSLVASVGYVSTALFGVNWSPRMQGKTKYGVSPRRAIHEFTSGFTFCFLIVVLLYILRPNWYTPDIFFISLIILFGNGLLVVSDITWGVANVTSGSINQLKSRVIFLFIGAGIAILQLTILKNQYSYAGVQAILYFFLLPIAWSAYKSWRKNLSFLPIKESNIFISIGTLKIIIVTFIIQVTYVIDNFLVAQILGLESLAIYAMAYSITSLFVSVVAGSIQRLVNVAEDPISSKNLASKKPGMISYLMILCLCLSLHFIFRDEPNQILRQLPITLILLLPTTYMRILLLNQSALMSRYSNNRTNALFAVIQISLFFIIGIPATSTFGIPGMAISSFIVKLATYRIGLNFIRGI
jgi:DMSO/TMAO reductase YedYZ heme-binding membrane subunit